MTLADALREWFESREISNAASGDACDPSDRRYGVAADELAAFVAARPSLISRPGEPEAITLNRVRGLLCACNATHVPYSDDGSATRTVDGVLHVFDGICTEVS